MLQNNYGEGIGIAMKEALNDYGSPNNSIDVLEARQLVYHGDPALSLYAPDLPDYSIRNVEINQQTQLVDSSEIKIKIVTANNTFESVMSVGFIDYRINE